MKQPVGRPLIEADDAAALAPRLHLVEERGEDGRLAPAPDERNAREAVVVPPARAVPDRHAGDAPTTLEREEPAQHGLDAGHLVGVAVDEHELEATCVAERAQGRQEHPRLVERIGLHGDGRQRVPVRAARLERLDGVEDADGVLAARDGRARQRGPGRGCASAPGRRGAGGRGVGRRLGQGHARIRWTHSVGAGHAPGRYPLPASNAWAEGTSPSFRPATSVR